MARLLPNPPAEWQPSPLGLAALESAIRAADPHALLVSARILRRVIKEAAGVGGIGLRVPHRKTFVIGREELLAIVDRSELDLRSDASLPEHVILIARPSAESLAEYRPDEALHKYWRLLFHARVHLALEQQIAEGRLGDAEIHQHVERIGRVEFDEIRLVLKQEDFLLPPKSDQTVYIEFAAVYWELRFFLPEFVRTYFPALEDLPAVEDLLKQDVDAEGLLAATRPPGASDPEFPLEVPHNDRAHLVERIDEPQAAAPPPRRLPATERSDRVAKALMAKADRVSKLGNLVRAAILRTRAARYSGPELAAPARERARSELGRLARRLQAALNFSDNEADEWTRSLASLLEQSARGIWTAEARMLYDLQKVCVDHERGIYTLDAIGWAMSLGRKPLKRFLPGQRDVMISKHLRSAARRLSACKLSHRSRSRLAALVQAAVHRAEGNLRARFKPLVDRVLDKVKLLPQNPPERVARKKLVDEILDRVVEHGFLSMGDFRDAVSRNNLKLPDLAGVQQFFWGDQLLQADRQLADSLDGVYRGGEVYRRWPQRLSSLAFGTPLGRLLTRYLALPFGGAFLILKGIEELVILVAGEEVGHSVAVIVSPPVILAVGVLILGLLYHRRFRELCLEASLHTSRAVRSVVVDLPAWVLGLELIRRIVGSWQFRVFKRYIFKPLLLSALAATAVSAVADLEITLGSSLVIFVVINLVLNSRIGRNVDEMLTDWVVNTWHRIRIHVVAALFRFVMDVFNTILETIERLLYTVDEWLRFRAGESRVSTVTKACLGSVWFFVNYVIRFCVNLMIEPQVNPIKHFPVVTVSHKVMLPLILALHKTLEGPLGPFWSLSVSVFIQFLFPGIFGFLVWELKENWQLYAANRQKNLRPVIVGHHGETTIQFLRPGFRSGTIPKIYARLRRAGRKAYFTRNWKAYAKQRDALHHVSESMRRFTDRELLELLRESRSWADRSISSGEIHLACNRILIELYSPELGEESMWLAFEEEAGWLVASIYRRGWSDSLSYARRHTLASALAGFYKLAGVDLVREQIEARVDPTASSYEITDAGLVIGASRVTPRRIYPLRDWPRLDERRKAEGFTHEDRDRWVFAATPISWRRWVVTWELDQLGGFSKHHVLENMYLLPG